MGMRQSSAPPPAVRSHQAADRPANQRYYTVISRAVTEQGENTFSSREALYERARAAQMAALQLETELVRHGQEDITGSGPPGPARPAVVRPT